MIQTFFNYQMHRTQKANNGNNYHFVLSLAGTSDTSQVSLSVSPSEDLEEAPVFDVLGLPSVSNCLPNDMESGPIETDFPKAKAIFEYVQNLLMDNDLAFQIVGEEVAALSVKDNAEDI